MRACMPKLIHFFLLLMRPVLMALLTSSFDSNFLPKTGIRRGENLKTLRRGCMVDVVIPPVQVVWWLPESWRWCEASRYRAEATFGAEFCQVERVVSASSFFFSVLIYESQLTVVLLCITPRRITPHSQHTATITFLADGEHEGATLSLLLHPSLFLPSDLQCPYRLAGFP